MKARICLEDDFNRDDSLQRFQILLIVSIPDSTCLPTGASSTTRNNAPLLRIPIVIKHICNSKVVRIYILYGLLLTVEAPVWLA
jgi:hypothetical protein